MSTLHELLSSVRSLFRREAAEASDLLADVTADLESDLAAREARLEETPMDAIDRLQSEMADNSSLDEVRRRIETLGESGLDASGLDESGDDRPETD